MFEIRRGNENLDSLLKKDFEKFMTRFTSSIVGGRFAFYIFLIQFCTYLVLLLQVLSEQDKNHKSGTNKVTYN